MNPIHYHIMPPLPSLPPQPYVHEDYKFDLEEEQNTPAISLNTPPNTPIEVSDPIPIPESKTANPWNIVFFGD